MAKKTTDEKIDDLALAMHAGFEAMDKKFEAMDKKISDLPDKAYIDDKLADLKGDLVILMRKEDTKLKTLVEILTERKLLTVADKKRILSLDPFPQLA